MTTSTPTTGEHVSTLAADLFCELANMKSSRPDVTYRDFLALTAMDALAAESATLQSPGALRHTSQAIKDCKWLPDETRNHLAATLTQAASGAGLSPLALAVIRAARLRMGLECMMTCVRAVGEDGLQQMAETVSAQLDRSFGSKYAEH